MADRTFYNEILTEHNIRPEFKHDLPDADIVLEGVNPSCGDDIWLKLKLDGDTICDGAFVGDGCAISQASADIMLGMVIGKILHRFIIVTVEVDTVMLGRNIDPQSYLYAFLLTVAFSAFVNLVMYFKLKKIDMVESLKSVE